MTSQKESMKYEIHPAANLFPMMPEAELAELAKDIKAKGLLHPIVIYQNQILDGRNRLKACEMSGIEPRYEIYSNGRSPTEYVMAANFKRRQLTAGQRAIIAAEALPMLEEEAKRRIVGVQKQRHGVTTEQVPELDKGEARQKAAEIAGVNPHYVSDAKKLKAEAPELHAAVASGEKSMKSATKELAESKPKPTATGRVDYTPANGMQFAKMAIGQLEKIQPRDTQREDAFEHVIAWINKNRKATK